MSNTPINIHDLVKLNLTAFRALSDEILTEAVPLLRAEAKRLHQVAESTQTTAKYIWDDQRAKAYAEYNLYADRTEIAERIPKKRKAEREKQARKALREGKKVATEEKEILIAPSIEIIYTVLEVARDRIAERILDRYQASFTDLLDRYNKVLAEGRVDRATGERKEATLRNFYDACSYIVKGSPVYEHFFEPSPEYRSRSSHDPLIESPARSLSAITMVLKPLAKREADHFVKSYSYRVVERTIERHYASTKHTTCEITKAISNNRIWDGATIDVTVISEGSEYTYKFETKCILNFSKFGRPFNQFPTREIRSTWEPEDQESNWKG